MKPRLLVVGILGAVVVIGFSIITSQKPELQSKPSMPTVSSPQEEKMADKKAAFAIFTNGTFRIFTDPRYHNLSSDVYIESTNPNIVLIQREGITWNDFFKTLPM